MRQCVMCNTVGELIGQATTGGSAWRCKNREDVLIVDLSAKIKCDAFDNLRSNRVPGEPVPENKPAKKKRKKSKK